MKTTRKPRRRTEHQNSVVSELRGFWRKGPGGTPGSVQTPWSYTLDYGGCLWIVWFKYNDPKDRYRDVGFGVMLDWLQERDVRFGWVAAPSLPFWKYIIHTRKMAWNGIHTRKMAWNGKTRAKRFFAVRIPKS